MDRPKYVGYYVSSSMETRKDARPIKLYDGSIFKDSNLRDFCELAAEDYHRTFKSAEKALWPATIVAIDVNGNEKAMRVKRITDPIKRIIDPIFCGIETFGEYVTEPIEEIR